MPAPTSRVAVTHLRAWRLSKLWTQEELATAAGVSVPTIVRGERGATISALSATRLARALGTSVQALREEEPPSP